MKSNGAFGVDYLSPAQLAQCSAADWQGVLGMAMLGTGGPGTVVAHGTCAPVPMAQIGARSLDGVDAHCEVWRQSGPLRSGRIGLVEYRASDSLLFGCISLDESTAGPGETLQQVATRIYDQLFGCLKTLGAWRPLRIWNYLPDINRLVDGMERYRIFNEARQQAFRRAGCSVRGEVPAACALGLPAGEPVTVYFLASAQPGSAIENPRQISACDYPPEYGVASPIFTRATHLNGGVGPMLFVSGTASIVGHRTVHVDDVIAQTRETVHNIRAVIAEANRVAGAPLYVAEGLRYKIYVRNPEDSAVIAREFAAAIQPLAPPIHLLADICRQDLLVEIEAVGGVVGP